MEMELLPDELLLNIFGYLKYEDIISLQLVSKRLSRIAKDESLWKYFCGTTWLLNEKDKSENWRDAFISSYFKFCGKRYQHVYPKIKSAWNQFHSFLEIHSPAILGSLKDGISEDDIDRFERIHCTKLPDSLRLLYRLYNGQRDDPSPGLFGSMLQYGSSSTLLNYGVRFIPLKPFGIIKYGSERDFRKVQSISVIFGEDAAGLKLSVVLPYGDNVADSYKYCVSVEPEDEAYYSSFAKNLIISPSFEDWFVEHVNRVVNGCYDIIHQSAILRYYYHPECVCKTNRITVKAGWARFFYQRFRNQTLFEYRIVLKMDEDAPEKESCVLLDRHWYILVDGKVKDEVHGKGVVGDQPVMRPGSTYSWVSRTSFEGPKGSMRGHFTMQYLNRPGQFELECPEFFMHCGEPCVD